MHRTLTYTEALGLDAQYNIADGHAHQNLNLSQQLVIANTTSVFRRARIERQAKLEAEFLDAFFRHQHKSYSVFPPGILLYSASLGIDVAARLLRAAGSTVGLLSPTFDNLHGLLTAQGVTTTPVLEDDLKFGDIDEVLSGCDCIFLVLPNNPTGFTLDNERLLRLVSTCAKREKMLIIDASFRYFDVNAPDIYNVLHQSSIKFIVIEDTGKFLSAADQKLGIILADNSTRERLKRICEDILLNVSPFTVALLTELLNADDRDATLNLIRTNRRSLKHACDQLGWIDTTQLESLSVALVQPALQPEVLEGVRQRWEANGLVVLPGAPFFWHEPSRGGRLLRFALMRDADYFQQAINRMLSLQLSAV